MNYFFKSKSVLNSILILGLTISISGCGPMYDTTFKFEPPKSESGQMCASNCENVKSQCIQLDSIKTESCNSRAANASFQCAQDIRSKTGKEPKWYECGKENCTDVSNNCEEQYKSCFQACGGRVTSETKCVGNCSAPPGQSN